jgi:hypothetical protein
MATYELPMPPAALLGDWEIPLFARSVEMEELLRAHWIEGESFPTAPFAHLEQASIGVLWTNVRAPVPGGGDRITIGMAEIFQPRPAKRWIMERQRWAMHQLFGFEIPDFVISFDAPWWAAETVSIARKLSGATHELLHCGQAVDAYGAPRFVQAGPRRGQPVWSMVAHDIEIFNLEAEWFGAEAAGVIPLAQAIAKGASMRAAVEAFGGTLDELAIRRELQGHFSCGSCGAKAA